MSPRKSRMSLHSGKSLQVVTFLLVIYCLESSLGYPRPRGETIDLPRELLMLVKCFPNAAPGTIPHRVARSVVSEFFVKSSPFDSEQRLEHTTGEKLTTNDPGQSLCGEIPCEAYLSELLERVGLSEIEVHPKLFELPQPNSADVHKRFDFGLDCPAILRTFSHQITTLTKKAPRNLQNPVIHPAFAAKRTTGPKRMINGRGWEPELGGPKGKMGSEFLGKRFAMGSEFLGKRSMGSEFLEKRGSMGSDFRGNRNMGSEFLGKRGALGSEFLGKRTMVPELTVMRSWETDLKEDKVNIQPSKKIMGSEFLGKRNNQLLNGDSSSHVVGEVFVEK